MLKKSPIIITNCTTRKTGGLALQFGTSPRSQDIAALTSRWKAKIEAADATHIARDLYRGRSFSEAKRAALELEAKLFIVSAGLGLVNAGHKVPNYDLSVATGSEFAAVLAARGVSAQQWWRIATRGGMSIHSLAADPKTRSIMIALPATYLRLVHDDLAGVTENQSKKLTIFTSKLGVREVPEQLRHCVAPYDERLESLPGFSGTRAEFPQRALRHYVNAIRASRQSREAAWSEIRQTMERLPWRELPKRDPKSDSEIKQLLIIHWESHSGLQSRLLRFLRDDLKVQCEQSRFRRIWRSIIEEQPT